MYTQLQTQIHRVARQPKGSSRPIYLSWQLVLREHTFIILHHTNFIWEHVCMRACVCVYILVRLVICYFKLASNLTQWWEAPQAAALPPTWSTPRRHLLTYFCCLLMHHWHIRVRLEHTGTTLNTCWGLHQPLLPDAEDFFCVCVQSSATSSHHMTRWTAYMDVCKADLVTQSCN